MRSGAVAGHVCCEASDGLHDYGVQISWWLISCDCKSLQFEGHNEPRQRIPSAANAHAVPSHYHTAATPPPPRPL